LGQTADIKIMPNPANSIVTVNGLNDIYSIELINIQGQVIDTISVNSDSCVIDVSNIANGVYLLKMNNSNQHKIEWLFVQH